MKKGQVALIVLVVSAVVLTIGLSLSKRSVVETRITTDEELLKKAFNAAESGVDYYLGTGQTAYTSSDNSVANVAASNVGGGSNVVNLGGQTLVNHNDYIWMVGHNTDGSLGVPAFAATALSVCVENGFSSNLLLTYFYKQGGNYKVDRKFGPVTAGLASCSGVSGMTAGIDLSSMLGWPGKQPILLVVEPVGAGTKVAAVATGGNFPEQAVVINSVGKAGNLNGTSVNREINVINQYQIPSFMLEAVTASGNVLSN
jgi:hypothetical protein